MNGTDRSVQIWPRVVYVMLVTVAMTLGATPWLLSLHRLRWIGWAAAVAFVISAVSVPGLRDRHARSTTVLETLGIQTSAIFIASILGLFPILAYTMGWTADIIFHTAARHPDDPAHWATLTALVVGFLFFFGGITVASQNVASALFPKTGVGNAPLYPKLTWRRFVCYAVFALAVVAVLLICLRLRFTNEFWTGIFLELVFVISSAPLNSEFEAPQPTGIHASTIRAVRNVVIACGFDIPERAQTGDSRFDRLISNFDLLAYREGDILAVQFKTAEPGTEAKRLDYTDVAALPSALWAVRKGAEQIRGLKVDHSIALLVLSGVHAQERLKHFADEEPVHIVELDPVLINELNSPETSPDRLREVGRVHFGIRILAAQGPTASEANG